MPIISHSEDEVHNAVVPVQAVYGVDKMRDDLISSTTMQELEPSTK